VLDRERTLVGLVTFVPRQAELSSSKFARRQASRIPGNPPAAVL
jgi:hypothetical protein